MIPSYHSPKGWRYLRVGETMQEGDLMPAGFGAFEPIRPHMIGNRVLGARSGFNDIVVRARKRRLPTKTNSQS